MATYRVQTEKGTYEIETADAPAKAQPDVFEKAVNYHTGNSLIDAPLGVLQGAAKGAASTGVGIGALARKVAGLPPLPAETYKADTEASGIGQGTGKFLEQAAEFAIPGSSVGKATQRGRISNTGTRRKWLPPGRSGRLNRAAIRWQPAFLLDSGERAS
jgi:hypothetical protein